MNEYKAKTAGELIAEGQNRQWKGSKESPKPPGIDEVTEMDYLFGLLSIEYPFFLPKSDGDLLMKKNVWISMIRPYKRPERMEAVQKCLRHFTNKGGPSVGDFLGLLKTDPAHNDYKALPLPEADKTKQQIQMEKIRGMLK